MECALKWIALETYSCEVGRQALEVLRHSLIQVRLCGLDNLILVVLLKLLCLLRLYAGPILPQVMLCDFLQ